VFTAMVLQLGVNLRGPRDVFSFRMNDLPEMAGLIEVPLRGNLWLFAGITVIFATIGRAVRGVTSGGAIAGAIVCFVLLLAAGIGGFAALLTVFVLTWVSTRLGYSRKRRLGTAEAREGRDALQVLANLGIATACALGFVISRKSPWLVAMGAALAEAAADTVSSEIGQAVGGEPRLVTTWKRAAVGTNGAVTVVGSAMGLLAAGIVALVCRLTGVFALQAALVCAGAGVVGMMADSVLGATLESRKLLGNNGVNFVSTAIAGLVAIVISF
jgi:uncharacterized protein (TIGR00297 family)